MAKRKTGLREKKAKNGMAKIRKEGGYIGWAVNHDRLQAARQKDARMKTPGLESFGLAFGPSADAKARLLEEMARNKEKMRKRAKKKGLVKEETYTELVEKENAEKDAMWDRSPPERRVAKKRVALRASERPGLIAEALENVRGFRALPPETKRRISLNIAAMDEKNGSLMARELFRSANGREISWGSVRPAIKRTLADALEAAENGLEKRSKKTEFMLRRIKRNKLQGLAREREEYEELKWKRPAKHPEFDAYQRRLVEGGLLGDRHTHYAWAALPDAVRKHIAERLFISEQMGTDYKGRLIRQLKKNNPKYRELREREAFEAQAFEEDMAGEMGDILREQKKRLLRKKSE